MNFDIKTEQLSGDAYVISLTGEVDLYTAPEFKQQLLEVIGQGGKDVIVDFSGTTFIDRRRSACSSAASSGYGRTTASSRSSAATGTSRRSSRSRVSTRSSRSIPRERKPSRRWEFLKVEARRTGSESGGRARGGGVARRRLRHGRRGERRPAPDLQNGQTLFKAATAGRVTRWRRPARAGRSARTSTTPSPADVKQGYPQSSIENVVLDQIRLGSGQIALLHDEQVLRRARCCLNRTAEVPQYRDAGEHRQGPGRDRRRRLRRLGRRPERVQHGGGFASLGTDGAAIFKGAGCAGCHTLSAAGSTGTIGPNLDQLKPSRRRSSPTR